MWCHLKTVDYLAIASAVKIHSLTYFMLYRSKTDRIDAKAEYAKRQGDKDLINLVVIGEFSSYF